MTDHRNASTATDPSPPTPPPAGNSRKRSPYGRERAVVGAVFLALVGALIVHGAWVVHHDTFRVPTSTMPVRSCSQAIHALYTEYAQALLPVRVARRASLEPRRPTREPEALQQLELLDNDLAALRPYCEREGSDALGAYTALTVWRFQAQDVANIEDRMLAGDAERALSYRSPNAAAPPEPSTGTTHER